MIGELEQMLPMNEILQDLSLRWVSDGYTRLQNPHYAKGCHEWYNVDILSLAWFMGHNQFPINVQPAHANKHLPIM